MSRNDGTIYYTEEELQERAYLADDTLIPDIPEDITAQFEEVLETYKDYSRKDNASEEDDEALDEFDDDADLYYDDVFKEEEDVDEPYDDVEEEDGYGQYRSRFQDEE